MEIIPAPILGPATEKKQKSPSTPKRDERAFGPSPSGEAQERKG